MFGTMILVMLNSVTADPANVLSVGVGNSGIASIAVGVLTIDTPQFTILTDPVSNTTLLPGEQRIVKVRLNTAVVGTYSGTLRVPSSDSDGVMTIALVGVILAALAPGMTVDPTGTVDFGSVDVTSGTSVRVVMVSSTGTGPLVCGTVVLAGTDYTKSADGISGVTIPAGQSRSVTLTLDPSAAVTRTGTLTIPATGVAPVVVNLTGVGTTGMPAPTPTLVTRFYLGRQDAPAGVTITDPGAVWANATPDPDHALTVAKGGPAVALASWVQFNGVYGFKVRLGRWVGPPLAAQAVDSPILCYAVAQRAIALGTNVTSVLRFGLWRAATGTVAWQSPLVLGSAVSPWMTSGDPQPRRFPAGEPRTWSVVLTVADGDRLVVELGFRGYTNAIGGAVIRYGGASTVTDLASTQTDQDVTYVPWLDIVNGLLVKP